MKLRHTRTLCEKYSADDSRELVTAYLDSLPKFTCHDMSALLSLPHIGILYIPARIGYMDQLIYGAEEPCITKRGGDLYMVKVLHVECATGIVTYAYLDDHHRQTVIARREFTKYRVRGNILVDSTNECVTH
jgi:hypothetical protein